jgi:hypothetical protein
MTPWYHLIKIKMKKHLVIFLCLALSGLLNAQEDRMSFHFEGISFKDLVDTIEKKAIVKIYYSDSWVDSLYLDLNTENDSLESVLHKALGKNGFSFIVTDNNKIIISRGFTIRTDFREQFNSYIKRHSVTTDYSNYVLPPTAEEIGNGSDEYKVLKIGRAADLGKSDRATLSGTVTDPVTGNPVVGAVIYVEKIKAGAVTNNVGYYSLILPKGQFQLECRMIGMRSVVRNFIVYSDGIIDLQMAENTNQLNEVIISANKENMVKNVRLGVEKISVKMLRQMPMGMGEADIIKSSLLLPGVQSVGEASGGYNVRGGSADQNLVLLNDAPVMNTSHFFGFFSAFNSDLIRDVTLYKSGVPARYGGRISSVMDIVQYEGNPDKVKISGGISPVTGRLFIDGPVKKGKSTFAIGSRATYSDWILGLLPDQQLNKSAAGFYDIQALFSTVINEKNSLTISGYFSNDKFDYYKENAFDYGNLAATLRWKHTFNPKLSVQLSAIVSNYKYQLDSKQDSTEFSSMSYELDQKILRADFLYFSGSRHKIEFGLDATWYSLLPGIQKPLGDFSLVAPKELGKEQAAEPAIYISDEFEVAPWFSVSGGVRAVCFASFGPGSAFQYAADSPLTTGNITDTISYRRGQLIKSYPGLEFRISTRFILTPSMSLKAGVQRMYQNLHMISNSTSISPTDIWKLSNNFIRPEMGDQFSIGIFNNFGRKAIETSVEAYYKNLHNIIDYKGGAVLLMNEHLETDLIRGVGKAYGIELMVKKQAGTITGWVSYTYSRTMMKVDSPFGSEKVNGGKYFPANYDKPHDLKIVGNAKLSRRFNISSIFVYNTGRPITYPIAFYDFNDATKLYYSNRNEYRIPDYMRLDLSATLNGNLKAKKLNHSSFTFTMYNVLGRRNPYSVFFKNDNGVIKGYQLSIFGQPIFMVTYNFKIFGNASGDF